MKILNALKNPAIIVVRMSSHGLMKWCDDARYLKFIYKYYMGEKLDLEDPKTFNEKLQWLKLYDRNPQYTIMVDKYAAKEYVANRIGAKYVIPTLGVWNHFDDIDFDTLPDQFVLKCTHDSGGLVVCKDKRTLDKKTAKNKIEKCLKRNYYWSRREWPYKDVQPRVIAEKYLTDDEGKELNDYKLMCFNGKVKANFVCSNRFSGSGLNVTFYDTHWERMPFERHYPAALTDIAKPESYDEMVVLAEKLSQGIPFLRVDFYEIQGKPYLGELTFFPGSGFEEFTPEKWDRILGDWIKLPG